MTHIMLVGNPNCGKTTLFNALTGDNQRVGNWPGVTVEKKTGEYLAGDALIYVTDLPGVYSLASSGHGISQDMVITAKAVISGDVDIIINVIDACHLERHLYLTSQLLELGKPVIIALNMMDIAKQRGITIDTHALAHNLQCPVVALQANKHAGISDLQQAILVPPPRSVSLQLALPAAVQTMLQDQSMHWIARGGDPKLATYVARRMLDGDTLLASLSEGLSALEPPEDTDLLMADARYQAVHQVTLGVQQKRSDASEYLTAKIDRIVLHRLWAVPIFFGMMYLMFLLAINVGGAFQDFFNITTDAVFVQGTAWLLGLLHAPNWLIALGANGIGKGINTTLTFIPVIASMFFFLAVLESSGYMARAAFVVDRVMRALGLPGKSFVPMIVGFGCNVPAIMAARTLDSERDRILTVLMSPFMSCSARLAIYTVFVAAFFPSGGQNIVFSLYLIGIVMAVATGFMLRKTVLHGQASPLIIELPAYHRPALRRLCRETAMRLRFFLVRAATLIIPMCAILGGFNAWMINTSAGHMSLLALFAQWITPVFSPMGIHPDNWPATVGLLTGALAKEVVVGSLNSLYAQMGHLGPITAQSFDFWGLMHRALQSIPDNLAAINPMAASAPSHAPSEPVYGIMFQYFGGKIAAYAYLLFILLYIPCVSTMAAIRQETNMKLMWFSISWSLMVAYVAAVLFYQCATITAHPQQTCIWGIGLSVMVYLFIWSIQRMVKHSGAHHVAATA